MTGLSTVEAIAQSRPAQSRPAQSRPAQSRLERLRDKKLELPFLEKANWITDYDKARAIAKKEKKLIFTYFTRSFAP